jgi:hypothetical protein
MKAMRVKDEGRDDQCKDRDPKVDRVKDPHGQRGKNKHHKHSHAEIERNGNRAEQKAFA